jgi:beta-lactam-binding protein with PASTA domain
VAQGASQADISDLIGMKADDAAAALEAAGIAYALNEAAPPGRAVTGEPHVVRVRFDSMLCRVELTVSSW